MEVKYIHLNDGTLLLFSKYLGYQHAEVAARVCDALPADTADAGFVDFYEGEFEVWGRSLSLGVESHGRTNRLLNETANELKVYDLDGHGWLASNRDLPYEVVGRGFEGLRQFKIL